MNDVRHVTFMKMMIEHYTTMNQTMNAAMQSTQN